MAKQTSGYTAPAKLTPPEITQYFPRHKLFGTLQELITSPRRIWISAPGGAGKTTLIRSFLTDDPRPIVWYQVDREDHDPAAVFFYLAHAAKTHNSEMRPLPVLSPEYLPNLSVFCRNYFRDFFAYFPDGCVLVFDDLQEGPGEETFGDILAAAIAELSPNSTLFIISREEPYPCFAKARMNQSLAHLGWAELRLSTDDARNFLDWAKLPDSPSPDPDRAYELTQGWLAGLLLFLETVEKREPIREFSPERTGLLFDYFAEEIFTRLPETTQNFLLICALPPSIDTHLAEKLSGNPEARNILRKLVRENHFTFRISTSPEAYRFHPLFRHFLLNRAETELDHHSLGSIRKDAASLLIAEGQAEPAAKLLIDAQAWPNLTELIANQAESLLKQGRFQTLLKWLDAIPQDYRYAAPWLCYWRGACLMAVKPSASLADLTRAYEIFTQDDDAVGAMMTWTMAINAIIFDWNDYAELDRWIDYFDQLRERYPEYPSPQIEAMMVQGIVRTLTWRQPGRADLRIWIKRLHELAVSSNNSDFRLIAGSNLVFYHALIGDLAVARSLVELLNSDLNSTFVEPLKKLVWLSIRGILGWMLLDRQCCLDTLEKGQAIIEQSGIHVMDLRFYGQVITLGLSSGDLSLAKQQLEALQAAPITAALDHSHSALLLADYHLLQGDTPKAIALGELAVKRSEDGGSPVLKAFSMSGLIQALYLGGELERADELLQEALILFRDMNYFNCYYEILAAFLYLEKDEKKTGMELLRKGLGHAAHQGYLNFHSWHNEIMTKVCREAHVADIEVDYVTRLAEIHQLDITPPDRPSLSAKEIKILTWVQAGKTSPEIAVIQGISERTVNFHIGNILRKLNVASRSQAVAIAMQLGIIN